ncbi:MAG: pantoate--beta-alanine ligase [Phycisphaeraceae bacterium]
MGLTVLKTVEAVRAYRRGLPGRVALVPTMGALHEGHLRHIHVCRDHADHVLVSVFVNPTQFNEKQDYELYPRNLSEDLARCAEAGADAVFAPEVEVLYPSGAIAAEVDVPVLTADLEGRDRPGHFQGVCRVVVKLLNVVQPDLVSFGRKDYQQLCVVRAVIEDLMLPIEIIEIPTVREADGLAMSSRNLRLSAEERQHALGLYKSLLAAKQMVEQEGETDPSLVEDAMVSVMRAHQVDVNYSAIRHPATLAKLECIEPKLTGGVVALVAGRVGPVRLIDNMLVGQSDSE